MREIEGNVDVEDGEERWRSGKVEEEWTREDSVQRSFVIDRLQRSRAEAYRQHLSRNRILIDVEFRDLYLSVPTPRTWGEALRCCTKRPEEEDLIPILRGVSGRVRPGQCLAILGGSGSGKTTLLNTISGRNPPGYVCQGSLTFNRLETTQKMVKEVTGYVQQHDFLMEQLSVRETLQYAADLRLGSASKDERREKVERMIRELGLTNVADSPIGGSFSRGISGGEKRRVSLGIQLLTSPGLVVADEPVSGLDAFSARNIIDLLIEVARTDCTVVCTLHQPRTQIFEALDLILVLSRGRMVYFGQASNVVSYFHSIDYPIPELTNPADYILDLITVDTRSDDARQISETRLEHLVEAFRMRGGTEEVVETPMAAIDSVQCEIVDDESDTVSVEKIPVGYVSSEEDSHSSEEGNDPSLSEFSVQSHPRSSPCPELSVSFAEPVPSVDVDQRHNTAKESMQPTDHQLSPSRSMLHVESQAQFLSFLKEEGIRRRVHIFTEFSVLLRRFFLVTLRDKRALFASLLQNAVLGIFLGLVFLQLGNDQPSIQDRLGAAYIFSSLNAFYNMVRWIVQYERQRDVFAREYADGMYSAGSFFFAKAASDLPFEVLYQLIFGVLAYWTMGLVPNADRFFLFLAILISSVYAAGTMGWALSTITGNMSSATVVGNTIFSLFLFVSGWVFTLSAIPSWISWMQHLSFVKYAFSAFSMNEFTGLEFSCPGDQALSGGICPQRSGDEIVKSLGIDKLTVGESIAFLWGFTSSCYLIAYFCLKYVSQKPKK